MPENSNNLLHKSNELMKCVLYEKFTEYKTFVHEKSILNDEWHNFIVPIVDYDELDINEVKKVVEQEKSAGKKLSYYIHEDLKNSYIEKLPKESFLGDDAFMQKTINHPFKLKNENIYELQNENIEEYIQLAKSCFSDWDDEEDYTKLFIGFGEKKGDCILKTILLFEDDVVASFGSVIIAPHINLAYLHNMGTHVEFRKRGYASEITKHLCNLALKYEASDVYALVEPDGGSYNLLKKFDFIAKQHFYIYSISQI